MKNDSLPTFYQEYVSAKADGYSFRLYDKVWVLDKNTTVYLTTIHRYLSGDILHGCLQTLAYYAINLSPAHVSSISDRLQHMLRVTGANNISTVILINYRDSLSSTTQWYLSTIRGFLRRWYRLGYQGIDQGVIRLLDSWTLKGNRKGDAVKRKDPEQGPLSDFELQAFNEGVVHVYEKGVISLMELAISLCVSNTGRRPIQISQLRVGDILLGKNNKGEPLYILNVPRAKHRGAFRTSFKAFTMSKELWVIMSSLARHSTVQVEKQLGCELLEDDKQQVPLFPDLDVLKDVRSLSHYRQLLLTDKLHIPAFVITDTLRLVVDVANIRSERTGELLHITGRRFRYTTGTRAAREGFGELVIAELLDHSDTQNAGVYVKNIPEHVERLDDAVGFQLAPYAQAFSGILIDSEQDAERGSDKSSRIRTDEGMGVGNCGEYGFCGANVPIPCYTCMHFQPWVTGPHEEVYQSLLSERERIKELTGDIEVAAVLDRSIIAVAQVIQLCSERRRELIQNGDISHG
ncbi:site-specific integrase [Citrobacter freundii]|uniref:site-specific integrase n=1 Tax=Citrobacter freundii TaxID=546 RepID=UPI0015EA8F4C|nr:site-specific integrase [Citrobacter freundii]QMN60447.1 recombinase [Citrobacter freundii]